MIRTRELTLNPRDLFAVLQAGKWIFVALFSLISIAGMATLLMMVSPTYEARAVLQLGSIEKDYIDDPERLVQLLTAQYGQKLQVKYKRGGVLQLNARAATGDESRDLLKRIVAEILAREGNISDYYLEQYRKFLDETDSHIRALEKELSHIPEMLDRTSDPNWLIAESRVRTSLAAFARRRLGTEINWRDKIKPPQLLQPVQSVEDIVRPGRLIRPRPKHYIVVILAAFVIATLAAFLVGYVRWITERPNK
jgi:hypothetical protein